MTKWEVHYMRSNTWYRFGQYTDRDQADEIYEALSKREDGAMLQEVIIKTERKHVQGKDA